MFFIFFYHVVPDIFKFLFFIFLLRKDFFILYQLAFLLVRKRYVRGSLGQQTLVRKSLQIASEAISLQ
jgi:hypothetical protein